MGAGTNSRGGVTDSGGDTSCSEGGLEVASFLSHTDKPMEAAILPRVDTDNTVDEATIHVLTEEHDSDPEEEPDDCSDLEIMKEEDVETEVVEKCPVQVPQVYEKNFISMQMEEYVRIKEVAKEKNVDPSKVLVINIGDDMAHCVEDRLVAAPSKKSLQIAGLRTLITKHEKAKMEAKRKNAEKSIEASKKIKLDGCSKDSS